VPQTAKKEQPVLDQRRSRPGQRQQERLQRQKRRQRRQRIVMSILGVILVIGLASLAFWQFQRYSAGVAAANIQHATATAQIANLHATATAQACTPDVISAELLGKQDTNGSAQTTASSVVGSPTPPAASPPKVQGMPKKLCSGLEYIDIKQGTGPVAKSGSTANVYYTGWVQGGQKFDSSYDHGTQPFSVPLGQGQVIEGWDQGLIGMRAGGTRRLIIPPDLAYGNQSPQGSNIPANATLIFDVTVVSVK
jgi:FKBP-type peptidyl-prolyl cis-trans isomerase